MTRLKYWRQAIFLSLLIHLAAGICLSFALPKIFTEKVLPVEEEFIDVDLTAENFVEESAAEIETFDAETIPEFEFPEIVMPELKIPETVFETPKFTPPEIAVKPVEIPTPPVVQNPPPPVQKISETEKTSPKVEKPVEENLPQKLNRPAVIVNEIYPQKGSGLGYTGKIILNVKINKKGEVIGADIVQGSGRMLVDSLAQDYIKKWNFRPALDDKGRPMESSKVIQFDFKKFS